ncbi:MAG: hypothetical protein P4L50_03275 [Anaerolineaceae bacterium]|nr:hypothetical protein [Anaerolineaceae bacterium]
MITPVNASIWQSLADQVPALVAFVLAIVFIVVLFIRAVTDITKSWQEFICEQNKSTTDALNAITAQLREMTRDIKNQIAEHDQHVDERIIEISERKTMRRRASDEPKTSDRQYLKKE